jgi:hypothetical protein
MLVVLVVVLAVFVVGSMVVVVVVVVGVSNLIGVRSSDSTCSGSSSGSL